MKNSPKMSSLKLKKRWFVLTHNSLDYYKSSEKNALKLGTLVLNSLCSVVPPDEKVFKETGKSPGRRASNPRSSGSAQGKEGGSYQECALLSSKELFLIDFSPEAACG